MDITILTVPSILCRDTHYLWLQVSQESAYYIALEIVDSSVVIFGCILFSWSEME